MALGSQATLSFSRMGRGGRNYFWASNGYRTILLLRVLGYMRYPCTQEQSMIFPKMSIALNANRLSATHGGVKVSKVIVFSSGFRHQYIVIPSNINVEPLCQNPSTVRQIISCGTSHTVENLMQPD